jgi:predicted SAM-dependent methyltransferase
MYDEKEELERAQRPARRLLRRLVRTPAFGWVTQKTLDVPAVRRAMTNNFRRGQVALGQRNSYAFPLGWVTVDWAHADVQIWLTGESRLPFADESQNIVFSAHLMEHLEDAPLRRVLHEAYRILRKGGALRIEVPDAEKLVRAYQTNDRRALDYFRDGRDDNLCRRLGMSKEYLADYFTVLGEVANYIDQDIDSGHIPVYASKEDFDHHLAMGLEAFNAWAQGLKTEKQRRSGGHSNALTYSKMDRMLCEAGFSEVRRAAMGETSIPGLHFGRGIRRLYDGVPLAPQRAFYTLFMEAFKERPTRRVDGAAVEPLS